MSIRRRHMNAGRDGIMVALAWLVLVLAPSSRAQDTAGPSTGAESPARDAETPEDEKPKTPFSPPKFSVLPADPDSAIRSYVKQDHWFTAVEQLTSNDEDFQGRAIGRTTERTGRAVPLPGSPYVLTFDRAAALPKEQSRPIVMTYLVPKMPIQPGTARPKDPALEFLLKDRRGVTRIESREPALLLAPHQNLVVVLSSPRERYVFFKTLPSMVPPYDQFFSEERPLNFQVILAETDRRVGLPAHVTTWTLISTIVMDGIDPNLITIDQQDALTDWLHLGGNLVLSGPDQLDLLRGSFLEPYLPAIKNGSRELSQADLDPIGDYWTLPEKKFPSKRPLVVGPRTVLGADLELVDDPSSVDPARWVPHTGDLVAERAVGRGRVVATAFPIASKTFVAWPHYDGFINAVLLRRPRRTFTQTAELSLRVAFADFGGRETDVAFGTGLRIFSRDVPADALQAPTPTKPAANALPTMAPVETAPVGEGWGGGVEVATGPAGPRVAVATARQAGDPAQHGYSFGGAGGPASWNDRSGVSVAAKEALRDATAINVPDRAFVFRMLAIYLVLLVPVNWLVFRLIGRVEWAWIAAPILALGAAVAVVRAAQLDIGFARSRSELIVLEGFGGYDRAHLTRYTSLYTSLSSRYAFQFDEPSAVVAPLTADTGAVNLFEQVREVTLRPERGVRLDGFVVDSNSVGTVHSEQMARLGGRVTLSRDGDDWQLASDVPRAFNDVGVLRADEAGRVAFADVGTLTDGKQAELTWSWLDEDSGPFTRWSERPAYRRDPPPGGNAPAPDGTPDTAAAEEEATGDSLRLWRPFVLATEQLRLRPGEARLIAWSDDEPEGLTITPTASQNTIRTFVLLHLASPPPPDPQRDSNAVGDYEVPTEADVEEMDLFGDPNERPGPTR